MSFAFSSVFLIFVVIGIWFLFSRKTINLKTDMRIFAIFISIIAIYVSSAFIRLELFASVGIIILGSIGLTILTQKIFEQNKQNLTKIIFPTVIIILFIIPLTMPENNTWLTWADFPPSILNGGSSYSNFSSNDWKDAMFWIKENTPEDAIIASWWDYGYWITTLSERTTIVDNATLIDWQIEKMAYSLITTPDNSWNILSSDYNTTITSSLSSEFLDPAFIDKPNFTPTDNPDCVSPKNNLPGNPTNFCNPIIRGMDADYVLIYLAGERFSLEGINVPIYTLEGGGDESKKAWFTKISSSSFLFLGKSSNTFFPS